MWDATAERAEAPAADPPEGTETTIDDWRALFIAVLESLEDFPEARKAAGAAIFPYRRDRQDMRRRLTSAGGYISALEVRASLPGRGVWNRSLGVARDGGAQ